MSYRIRQTVNSDYKGVEELLVERNMLPPVFSPKMFDVFLQRNSGFSYVAQLSDSSLVGSAFGSHDVFTGHISKVAVRSEFERRHIASELVEAILGKLKEADVRLIYLHTRKDNEPAIKLFNSLGFEVRGTHLLMDIGYKPTKLP